MKAHSLPAPNIELTAEWQQCNRIKLSTSWVTKNVKNGKIGLIKYFLDRVAMNKHFKTWALECL